MDILERYESFAQNSVRTAPIFFDKTRGSELFDDKGNRYIDFHSAGGTLSSGHDNRDVRDALIDYLSSGRVLQTSDRTSVAKRSFVESFVKKILQPRKLAYKILFTDPTSSSAVEMALRLARRHKNTAGIVAFTRSGHRLFGGAGVPTGHPAAGVEPPRQHGTVLMPYCGYLGADVDTLLFFRRFLEDPASGLERPAAVIVETVQVHGGVNVASDEWLKGLEKLCRDFGMLLIVDETLTGCSRTGPYFSFEKSGIEPDIVVMSNAIAGGLPMSMLLFRPEVDQLRPGTHSGVFQGDGLAFVAATQLLKQCDEGSSLRFAQNNEILADRLSGLVTRFPNSRLRVRGAGMVWGLEFGRPGAAAVISGWALERGVIVVPAEFRDDVLLVLPPINTDPALLREGLSRLDEAVSMFLRHESDRERSVSQARAPARLRRSRFEDRARVASKPDTEL
jgi:diaminobutyrate-2-oxoglutarate transaminase